MWWPDPSVLSNFRPICKLPFISKVLEKVVFNQLQEFLKRANVCELFQSGFKPLHCTETALLKVFNDLLLNLDPGNCGFKGFNPPWLDSGIWHSGSFNPLLTCVGIKGTALKWFESYLSERSFSGPILLHGGHSGLWSAPGVSSGPPAVLPVHATPGLNLQEAWNPVPLLRWWRAGVHANKGPFQRISPGHV